MRVHRLRIAVHVPCKDLGCGFPARRLRGVPRLFRLHQPLLHGEKHQFRGAMEAEGIHHPGAMDGHRIDADVQKDGNFFVGFPLRDELQDFLFPEGETFVGSCVESRNDPVFKLSSTMWEMAGLK